MIVGLWDNPDRLEYNYDGSYIFSSLERDKVKKFLCNVCEELCGSVNYLVEIFSQDIYPKNLEDIPCNESFKRRLFANGFKCEECGFEVGK